MNFQTRTPAAPVRFVLIGDVARRLGVTARTLRYYQDQGLIQSHRLARNTRGYDIQTIAQLEAIVALRAVGLPIADIRAILDLRDHPANQIKTLHRALSEALREQQTRIRQLMALTDEMAQWRQDAPLPAMIAGLLTSSSQAPAA